MASAAGLLAGTAAAQPRRGAGGAPLRIGFERLLVDCGTAGALRRAFAADTGLTFDIVAGASSALLEALERGELDAAATHAPDAEARLERAGLIHDRRLLASTDFLVVGPLQRGRDPAGLAGSGDAAAALARIAQAAAPFVTRGDGSGTHLAEQALWRAAGVAPAAPWYRPAAADGTSHIAQARAAGAYALTDRASWLAAPPAQRAGLGIVVAGDPRLATQLHAHRSFRANHPAGKLFSGWIAGPIGRRVVARTAGLRAPPPARRPA